MSEIPEDSGHVWHLHQFASMTLKCCKLCGFVFNPTQPNKPCRGQAYIGLRKSASSLKALDG
jgi:hypothetical protein